MTAEIQALVAAAKARTRALEASFAPTSIGRFVAERCRELGDAPLLDVFGRGERATYAEMDRLSNRIGHALLGVGIRKGDRVAIMLPNRLAYPAAWLALAKIGAVHVPVNTRYTPREIAYVLGDSGASAMIADAALVAGMGEGAAGIRPDRLLVADEPLPGGASFDRLVAAASDTSCLDERVGPDDLLNIQYTSGTTGFPKGCKLSHGYWSTIAFAAQHWDAEPARRLMTAQPFFYMDPPWHLLKAMRLGGELFMAPGLSSSRFIGWIKEHRVEWCQFPELMTRQPEAPDDRRTALRQVATFGWSPETCRAFKTRFGVRAREGFGMTEIGLGTWMPPELEALDDSGSVGFAGPFRETSVRDEAGARSPEGEVGELWVRGPGLFAGYWRKPEADRDAFRPAEDGGLPWFRTGDLFREDGAGLLWLVGRIKDMIRRSSENIAAREVEAVLRELPEIEDVAVVAVPDPDRGEEVKVYVQLKAGLDRAALPVQRMAAHARAHLAAFKAPRYYAYVDGFPRTVSNKIEKRSLVAGSRDLRIGSYDLQDALWR